MAHGWSSFSVCHLMRSDLFVSGLSWHGESSFLGTPPASGHYSPSGFSRPESSKGHPPPCRQALRALARHHANLVLWWSNLINRLMLTPSTEITLSTFGGSDRTRYRVMWEYLHQFGPLTMSV